MELANQPARRSEGTVNEHHAVYLPAMPPRRVVAALQRVFARLNRL